MAVSMSLQYVTQHGGVRPARNRRIQLASLTGAVLGRQGAWMDQMSSEVMQPRRWALWAS